MSEADIRAAVVQYLAKQSTLQGLDATIATAIWDPKTEPEVRDLANGIALRIDEYSSGACDDNQLRHALLPVVTRYEVRVGLVTAVSDTMRIKTANSTPFTASPVTTSTVVGRRLEAVPS